MRDQKAEDGGYFKVGSRLNEHEHDSKHNCKLTEDT